MLDDIIDDRKKIEEFYKTIGKSRRADVEGLKIWIFTHFDLKKISEYFVILCYHSCYYNIEDTRRCIENFLRYKIKYPNFLQYKNPTSDEFKRALSLTLQAILPERTRENYDIVYLKSMDTNTSNYNFERQLTLINMICSLQFYQRTVSDGLIIILDCADYRFGHIFRTNLFLAKAFFNYLQEAAPVRLKAVHVVNTNYVGDKLYKMLTPLVNQRIRNMIKCHTSNETVLETIPKDILPVEIGGTWGTIRELHGKSPGVCFKCHVSFIPAIALKNIEENLDFFHEDEEGIDILKSVFQRK